MTNTKQRHLEILSQAHEIIEANNIDIAEKVTILPLAKKLAAVTGCHITTAKNNVAKAVRQKRGEPVGEWGGNREGAGRPPKGEK